MAPVFVFHNSKTRPLTSFYQFDSYEGTQSDQTTRKFKAGCPVWSCIQISFIQSTGSTSPSLLMEYYSQTPKERRAYMKRSNEETIRGNGPSKQIHWSRLANLLRKLCFQLRISFWISLWKIKGSKSLPSFHSDLTTPFSESSVSRASSVTPVSWHKHNQGHYLVKLSRSWSLNRWMHSSS